MRRFITRRLIFGFASLVVATFIVLSLSRAVGDPLDLFATSGYGLTPEGREEVRRQLGLDRPVVVQYVIWLGNAFRGDLGVTLIDRTPIIGIVLDRLPATLHLGLMAWVLATVVGIPIGVLSAVRRGSYIDYIGRGVALLGQAVPQFWLGLILILLFGIQLRWFPVGLRGEGIGDFSHWVLPTITLGTAAMASYMRLTRNAMLEVLDSEFVRMARAKGVNNQGVVWNHALRNALIQPLTASTLILAGFLTGALLVEQIFVWPGLGDMAITAVNNNDFPLLMGAVFFFTILYVGLTFVTDLLYAVIDPRIRYD